MKKVLFTLALAAFAFAANAQFVLGGSLGFQTTGGSYSYVGDGSAANPDWTVPAPSGGLVKTTDFSIAPKIGYQLNDKMQVGAALGFSTYVQKDYNPSYSPLSFTTLYRTYEDFEGWEETTSNYFFFAPYFRYNICTLDKFTFFCELQAKFGINPREKYHQFNTKVVDKKLNVTILDETDTTFISDYKQFGLDVTLTPGLNYKFNDHFSADLYIDLLGIRYSYTKGTSYNWNFNDDSDKVVYVDSDFGLNANLEAQTLRNHLGYFRLGFNYHF